MSGFVHEAVDYSVVEGEPPEILGRNLNTAAHLLASATTFFFLAFIFAFFYLRSLDNHHMWRPKGVHPSLAYGTLVMALSVASALLVRRGLADHRRGRRRQWRISGALALGAGLAALLLQILEWIGASWGPTGGGFASVYVGWTGFNALFVLGTLFWLENILATSFHYARLPSGAPAPGEASGDPDRLGHDIHDPLSLVRSGLESLSFYWAFLAGLGVLMWIVLYLV